MAESLSIEVEYGRETQSLGALREAAYRIIGAASCRIEQVGGRYICHLLTNGTSAAGPDADALRRRFLDLVTDENLREKVSAETDGVRNVILALAFGALASPTPVRAAD